MFHMTVGEGKVGALVVAVRWHVPPLIGPITGEGRIADIAKLSVKNGVFVFVDKDKKVTGNWMADLRVFLPRWKICPIIHKPCGGSGGTYSG